MLLPILILLPLLGGLALYFFKKPSLPATLLSGVTSIFAAAILLFYSDSSFQATWLSALNISFSLKIDGLSKTMLFLTSITAFLISLASNFTSEMKKGRFFYALILCTQAALYGIFLAQDLFSFYFFFEAALIPVFILALKWGDTPKASYRMLVYTIAGSLFLLVSLIFMYTKGQTADLDALKRTAEVLPLSMQRWVFWGLFIAFAIKMPLFPFHTWQADAYAGASPTATMFLAAILSKMGVYGILRLVLPLSPAAAEEYGGVVILLALIGLIYGSIIAIKQNNVKKILAFSSFAHISLMAAGVMTLSGDGIQGAIFQMVPHGLAAVGLFFIADILFQKSKSHDLESLGGLSQKMPVLVTLYMVILLSSVALPLTAGFVGEFLLLKSIFDYHEVLGILAGLTIIFGAVYMLRLMQRSMFGELKANLTQQTDISSARMAVLIPLAILVIALGVYPFPILEWAKGFLQILTFKM